MFRLVPKKVAGPLVFPVVCICSLEVFYSEKTERERKWERLTFHVQTLSNHIDYLIT